MPVTNRVEPSAQAQGSKALIDRRALDQLLEDVGAENLEAVVGAFLRELATQTTALEDAAGKTDLDGMEQVAHRLKSSAASFGAARLSQILASIEQAARTGKAETAVESLRGFRELANASYEAMDVLRREVSGSGA